MSDQEPGPTHTPYGQPDPYGQPTPYGQQGQPSPYGQQPSYGPPPVQGDRRPGTVTAAAWITIVFSGLTAVLFGLAGLALLVARDQVITEMERVPDFEDANFDAGSAVGLLLAVMLGLVVWCVVAIVLSVMVLRRSGIARILLVISAAVTVVVSLISIASLISALPLIAAVATIVLLFTGGASAWFNRTGSSSGGSPGGPTRYQDDAYGSQPYPSGHQQGGDPYGQQPPGADNPYGYQSPSDGGSDHPPRDYPDR